MNQMPVFQIQPPTESSNGPEPPMRVQVALELLNQLSQKQAPKSAVTDYRVDWHPGEKLTNDEICVRTSACRMLQSYFDGKLRPDWWEKKIVGADTETPVGPGLLLQCFACHPNPPQPECKLCKGTGQLLVFST